MRIRIIVSMMVLLAFVSIFANSSYAEPQNTGTIVSVGKLNLEAQVPEGFDNSLLINFTADGGNSVVKRLEHINKYKSSEEMPVGKYKIGFINLVGKNATDYDVKHPENLTISKDGDASFKIVIALKASAAKKKNEPIQEPQENLSEQELENMLKQIDENKSVVTEPEKDPLTQTIAAEPTNQVMNESAEVKSAEKLPDETVNLIIFLAGCAVAVLLFFVFRLVAYKHDFYDIGG